MISYPRSYPIHQYTLKILPIPTKNHQLSHSHHKIYSFLNILNQDNLRMLTLLKKTANNLQPPLIFLLPAKLNNGKLPLINKACNIGFNVSSPPSTPSSFNSVRPHSGVKTSARASAECLFKGGSRLDIERCSTRGRGGVGRV